MPKLYSCAATWETYILTARSNKPRMSHLFTRLTSRRRVAIQVVTGAAAALASTAPVEAAQPHMQAALRALNNASEQLNAAEPDKAGHREKAIGLVRDAIGQVQEGIRAGR